MDLKLHAHVPISRISKTWVEDRALGRRNLYTNPYWLGGLMTVLFVQVAILQGSGIFLSKQAFWSLNSLLMAQPLLAALLYGQALSRSVVDEEVNGRYYWLTSDKFDIMAMAVAGIGTVGAGLALGYTAYGLYSCAGQRDSITALIDFIFLGQGNATLVEAYRTPNFATELLWLQLCLDDFAMAIAYIIFVSTIVLVDLAVFVFEGTVRNTTRRIILLQAQTPKENQHISIVRAAGNGDLREEEEVEEEERSTLF
jgi:hypothetical protein